MTVSQTATQAIAQAKAEAYAQQVLAAEAAVEHANANLRKAKDNFILAAREAGVQTVELAEAKVTWTDKVRRMFDVSVLSRLLNHATFEQVTKVAVDTKKFDAARELGQITAEIEDAATTKRVPYTEVRSTKK